MFGGSKQEQLEHRLDHKLNASSDGIDMDVPAKVISSETVYTGRIFHVDDMRIALTDKQGKEHEIGRQVLRHAPCVVMLVHDIPVRFYTTATPELAAAYAPDHILWAAGGRPIAPKAIPGLDCPKVYLATEALCDCCDVGEHVVVIGGGLVGVETALQMDMWGKHVTCIDMAKTIPSEPGFKMNDMLMRDYMARSNVDFRPATKLVRIDGDAFTCSVTVEHAHEQQQIACDTVLLALGFAPTAQAAAAFEAVAPVTVLGDAQQPRKILFAVGDAHEAVRKLSD